MSVYAHNAHYNNLASTSFEWKSATHHLYIGISPSGEQYSSRCYFNINYGDGRPIKITNATIRLYRNDGDTLTNNVQIRIGSRTNSVYTTGSTSASTGSKYYSLNAAQREAIAAANKSYVVIYFDSTGSRIRFTGYDNGSYEATAIPYLSISWEYEKSAGTVTSGYYDSAMTLNLTSPYSTYSHKVEWLLPDYETTGNVYYTQTLAAGVTSSSCTYYGDNASAGSADALGDYFSSGYSQTFYVRLTTYDASGATVGSVVYPFTLNMPTGYSMGSIKDCDYNVPASLTFTPAYPTYYHKVKWYIRNNTSPVSTSIIESTGNSNNITTTFNYFGSLSPDDYFTIYSDKCKASVVLETYTAEGDLQGTQSLSFKLVKEYEGSRELVTLNPSPIIMDTSVIVTNPVTGLNTTLNTFFSDFEDYIMDQLHPVGSIYISYSNTSPSTLFGVGTWTSFGPARTLYTTDSASTTEVTGGSFTHTLTTSEMPKHNHCLYRQKSSQYTGTGGTAYGRASSGSTKAIRSAGSGTAHNNTQPYAVCYMWKRTA